jgi:hypothetical protein
MLNEATNNWCKIEPQGSCTLRELGGKKKDEE